VGGGINCLAILSRTQNSWGAFILDVNPTHYYSRKNKEYLNVKNNI